MMRISGDSSNFDTENQREKMWQLAISRGLSYSDSSTRSNSNANLNTISIQNSTKTKLDSLNERLSGFEKQIELDLRNKRDHDEGRIFQLQENIQKLDKSLNNEVMRRVEASKSLHSLCEDHVDAIEERFQVTFVDKLNQLQVIVEGLNDRMNSLEKEMELLKNHRTHIEREQQEAISRELNELKVGFEAAKEARFKRESTLDTKVEELNKMALERLETDQNDWKKILESIESQFESMKRVKNDNDQKFQSFVIDELNNQKNAMVLESQAREMADDDIVQAVNHYTKALQEALQLVT